MKGKVSKSGFTLVELMVVVAIIGILSAIAIPNFKKYQAKSKTSEAKLQLAALYTAEVSFSTDFDVYATCLDAMGYDPSENVKSRYYAVGFPAHSDGALSNAENNGATSCTSDTLYFFQAGKTVGGKAAASADYLGADAGLGENYDTFIAAAGGVLDADHNTADTADLWTINENKQLKHANTGF